jgi:hypothetical protein
MLKVYVRTHSDGCCYVSVTIEVEVCNFAADPVVHMKRHASTSVAFSKAVHLSLSRSAANTVSKTTPRHVMLAAVPSLGDSDTRRRALLRLDCLGVG